MATITKRRRAGGKLSYRVQDRTTGFPSYSETFPTLKDAREKRDAIRAERKRAMAGIKRGRQTLAEAITAFTDTADFRQRKAAGDTRRHLDWWCDRIGNLPLAKIAPDLIADQLHGLEAGGRSGATVNRYRSALSRVFRYAVNTRRWTDHNPCAMVERRPEGRRRERVITADEWKALLAAAKKLADDNPVSAPSQLSNFLRVLYGTGARKSDIRFLRWAYIDLAGERMVFPDTKNGDARTMPLMGDALAAIRQQKKVRRDGCPWVFPQATGDARPASFDYAFRDARAAADLDRSDARGEKLVIHSLRHSVATEAGRAGATAFEIAAMTGHRTLAMVQRYTKTDEMHARAALAKRKKQR